MFLFTVVAETLKHLILMFY